MQGMVSYDGETSELFTSQSSIKQGCVLTPTLFSMFCLLLLNFIFRNSRLGVHLNTWNDGRLFNFDRLSQAGNYLQMTATAGTTFSQKRLKRGEEELNQQSEERREHRKERQQTQVSDLVSSFTCYKCGKDRHARIRLLSCSSCCSQQHWVESTKVLPLSLEIGGCLWTLVSSHLFIFIKAVKVNALLTR